jgi:hypothetical protein
VHAQLRRDGHAACIINPVADREKGLPAVRRKGRRLRFMAPARKQGADRKSLVKYVDENSLLLTPPQ